MKNQLLLLLTLGILFPIFSSAQISWFADPVTVGFNYLDGNGIEQQTSSWQPGSLRFYVDTLYDSGSELRPQSLDITEYTSIGSTRYIESSVTVRPNSLRMKNFFGYNVVEIDHESILKRDESGWKSVEIHDDNAKGQIDVFASGGDPVIASLGHSQTGSNGGRLGLSTHLGEEKVVLDINANNKGEIHADLANFEKVTVNSDGSDFSGVFLGGKGIRAQSASNAVADLTLQGNSAGQAAGVISSDPNYNGSYLHMRSFGGFFIDLDHNDQYEGLQSFLVRSAGSNLMWASQRSGAVIEKISAGVSEPHLSVQDRTAYGYGRINIGNGISQQWQIAGKASGPSETKFLLFHLTNASGATGADMMQLRGDGNLYIEGDYGKISDIRLKTNIVRVDNAIERVSKLNGYHYNWKDPEKSPRMQTGVIAQEVAAVFPELVDTNTNGNLSVNYDGLIPYLIEAIKDLREEIDQLKRE